MTNTDTGDIRKRLATLSEQERNVLRLRCGAADYKTIGATLHLAVPTVKSYMSRIYVKLGIDQIHPTLRIKTLYGTFCPVFSEGPIPEILEGEVVEEPVSLRVEQMVDEDEYAIVLVKPQPTKSVSLRSTSRAQRAARIGGLGIGVVLCICVILAAVGVIFGPNLWRAFTGTQSTPTMPVSADEFQQPPTVIEGNPTETPAIGEEVVVLTATLPPATLVPTREPVPSIVLPFTDNFEQGSSSDWRTLSGKWITAGGRFTVIGDESNDDWVWSVLDDPTWQNYRLTVNTEINYPYSAAQGQLAIAVRMSDTQTEFLGFVVDTFMRGGWAFIGSDENDVQYIAGSGDYLPDTANIELEVSGNQFIARVNGQLYQTITISGYEKGGIGLGIVCDTELGKCPSFDNFEIQSLSQ